MCADDTPAASAVGAMQVAPAVDAAPDAEPMQASPSVTYNDVRPKPMWAEAAERQASWMEFILMQLDAFRGPIVREV